MACWPFSTVAADAEGDSDVNVAAPRVALTCVTATDVDGQGACWAEGGGSTVNHKNRQEVHILFMAVKAWPLGANASCVVLVCGGI